MNNFVKTSKNSGKIARRTMMQYFLALFVFVITFIGSVLVAWQICSAFTWYSSNPLYWILIFIRQNLLVIIGIILLIGWIIITYHFFSRPLRYLDEMIAVSGQLMTSKDTPIKLPDAMKHVQDELNLFREQAIRNELLAKEAEQRKNDLIIYLAHDLKTPLTSVIGYLTLLRDEPDISSKLRARYTNIALDKAERLEYLINEFFDITRFNLTSLTLEAERTNLSRMLDQITSEFIPILLEKELTWNTSITSDIEIICDPDKLERVFDNLIRNAVNYSYVNTELFLSARLLNKNVEIVVSNHGKTIPPDKLGRIFDQFFRLDSSRSSSTGGAGLGLAISKEIVELHGGFIRAASENESITFTILLPVDCHNIVSS